jgi:hypothetical protein
MYIVCTYEKVIGWPMPIIPAIWEAEVGGFRFKTGPGQMCEILFEKQALKR